MPKQMAEFGQTRTRTRFAPRAFLLMIVAVACICGGLWYLSRADHNSSSARRGLSGRDPLPATHSKTQGVEGLHLTQSPPVRLPAAVRNQIVSALGPRSAAVRPFRTQHIATPQGDLWLVDGREQSCLIEGGKGGITCASNHLVRRYGLAVGIGDAPTQPGGKPHNFLLLGIAPDSIHRVLLKIGAGTQEVPVRHNVYTHRANVPIVISRLEP
jgi:hypothetical protein